MGFTGKFLDIVISLIFISKQVVSQTISNLSILGLV